MNLHENKCNNCGANITILYINEHKSIV